MIALLAIEAALLFALWIAGTASPRVRALVASVLRRLVLRLEKV